VAISPELVTGSYALRLWFVSSPRLSSNETPGTPDSKDTPVTLLTNEITNTGDRNTDNTDNTNTGDTSTTRGSRTTQLEPKTARRIQATNSNRGGLEGAWAWILRLSWFSTALFCAPLFGEALASRSRPVQLCVAILAWIIWGAGLVATLVPHPIGLVGLRTGGPLLLAASVWATAQPDTATSSRFMGLVCALIVTAMVLFHETGHFCVNGPAYPNERRFLLRPSASLLIIAPVATALVAAGLIAGPLLLASRQWILGGVLTGFGFALAYALTRSLFALARRFLVFVPAGFVIHDYSALREPVLFKRGQIERLRAAPADTDSLDLTLGAPGLVLEVLLKEKVEMSRLTGPRDRVGETGKSARFLAVPTLPGRLLNEARSRHYPVGQ
jgi:hypothetical protein